MSLGLCFKDASKCLAGYVEHLMGEQGFITTELILRNAALKRTSASETASQI